MNQREKRNSEECEEVLAMTMGSIEVNYQNRDHDKDQNTLSSS